MAKTDPKLPPPPDGGEPDAYDLPDELAEPEARTAATEEVELIDEGGSPPARPGRPAALKLAIGAAVVLIAAVALLVYRTQHRRAVVGEGLRRADALLRLDTAAGYREAASVLEPVAALDPLEAGSARAFALAMLFADYRDTAAEPQAEALLVEPGRAEVVPRYAHLATAALALGRKEAGTATTAAGRARGHVWADTLQARVALLAGSVSAAVEPAAAAAEDGSFAAGQAVEGDVLRRARADAAGAKAAYQAALAASPTHPRAAYGLAKLALGGRIPAGDATPALERLIEDVQGTPAPERARAALHLAALRLRANDRTAADAALDAARLDPAARAWAERAAVAEASSRDAYRVVDGAPASASSASDDDPWVPPPPPPISDHVGADPLDARPPPPAHHAVPKKAAPAHKATAAHGTKAAKAGAKKPAKPAAKKAAKKKPVAG